MTVQEKREKLEAFCDKRVGGCNGCVLQHSNSNNGGCYSQVSDEIVNANYDLVFNSPVFHGDINDLHSADPVNNPAHYTQGGIECIDAIKASMSPLEYAGFLKGNALKYLWRYRHKGKAVQDLKKANWYLGRLTRFTELEEAKK